MSEQSMWVLSAVLMMLGLVVASLGAHGPLAPTEFAASRSFDIAVLVHWVHGLSLMVFILYQRTVPKLGARQRTWVLGLVLSGVFLFSGSIYLQVLSGISALAGLTPFGGLLLFAFWGYWLWLLRAVE